MEFLQNQQRALSEELQKMRQAYAQKELNEANLQKMLEQAQYQIKQYEFLEIENQELKKQNKISTEQVIELEAKEEALKQNLAEAEDKNYSLQNLLNKEISK